MFLFVLFILIILLALLICFFSKKEQRKKYYGGNKISELTYSIDGEDSGLDYSQLRKILNSTIFKEKNSNAVNLSIGGFNEKSFLEKGKSAYSPSFISQHASLKNLLDNHRMVTEKTQLYNAIKIYSPGGMKYIPYTVLLSQIKDSDKLFTEDKLYLLKKNKGRQTGIKLVNSNEGLNSAIKELDIKNKEDGILSLYIKNPLTINGKKFHLRVYFIVYMRWGITYCTAFHEYRIYTASGEYKAGDWLNEKIHISGVGDKTTKRYYWKDVEPIINEETMEEFKNCIKQVCDAMVVIGMKPFNEADAAYHTFGADILLTDDNKAYLLEINRRPGFTQLGEKEGWDEYNKDFSYKYFLFIANNIIFPFFGLGLPLESVPLTYIATFPNGYHSSMSKFSHIFISHNLNLIPLSNASDSELHKAHKIDFYSLMSFKHILDTSDKQNIWLISKNKTIIGYISLTHAADLGYYIQLGIEREHQKRQIGTAIVALIIEIYSAREYPKNPTIYFPIVRDIYDIKKNNTPTNKICEKLEFTIHNKTYYSRLGKINSPKNNILLNSKLSYFSEYDINIDAHFTKKTITSFVHVSIGIYHRNLENYYSTGMRYNIDFINQGSELKNILNIDKSIYYQEDLYNKIKDKYPDVAENMEIRPLDFFSTKENLIKFCGNFLISIRNGNGFRDDNLNLKAEDLKDYKFSDLSEYKYVIALRPPLLIDGKKTALSVSYVVYKSGGIIRAKFIDNYIIMAKENYTGTNFNTKELWPSLGNIRKVTPSIEAMIDTIELKKIIDAGINTILEEKITLYENQYAGFKLFNILVYFENMGPNILAKPIISEIFQSHINQANDKLKQFLIDSIIYPHFGIKKFPKFEYTYNSKDGPLSKYYNIVIRLNIDIRNNNHFDIYYDDNKIGNIELGIIQSEIEIKHIEINESYRKKGLGTASVAYVLEILGARYAPINPFIYFIHNNNMNSIIINLHFQKSANSFRRLCRINHL